VLIIVKKFKWSRFKLSFPCICGSCNELLWEHRKICERCGCEGTIRTTTKKDFKAKYKKVKVL